MRLAAFIDGGSYGVSVSTPGPSHSQVSTASTLQTDWRRPATLLPCLILSILQGWTWPRMAAAGGGGCTTPVLSYTANSTLNPITWCPLFPNSGCVVMGEHHPIPNMGGPGVYTCHLCTCGPPGHGKSLTLSTATTMENKGMS